MSSKKSWFVGLAAGLGVGLVLLAGIALVIRAGSVRLPIRAFFKLTGFLLFAMAVVFAGNGINELQVAGILKTTPMHWLGQGVPILGLHPTVQTLSVQALLLCGAILALVVMLTGETATAAVGRAANAKESAMGSASASAGVGI